MWFLKKGGGLGGDRRSGKIPNNNVCCLIDYLSSTWKVFKIWLLQIISSGGAGGEGFFAGSRFGGFTKQLLLIWAILAGLLIHTKRCLHLRLTKIRPLLLVGYPMFI